MQSERITINLKLFSGLHREVDLKDYDTQNGAVLEVKKGTRLRALLKSIGMKNRGANSYYRGGGRIGLWRRLHDGDEIQCFKPTGGG